MRNRLAAILPAYLALYAACYGLAFGIRFDFATPDEYEGVAWTTLPFVLAVKFLWCAATREWQRTYRYVTVVDLAAVAGSSLGAAATLLALNSTILHGCPIPRSVICVDFALTLLAVGALRTGYRAHHELLRPRLVKRKKQRALIYGVRRSSLAILRMLQATQSLEQTYRLKGFVDPSEQAQQSRIGGLPVFPIREGWAALKAQTKARHLLIPGGTPGRIVRELLHVCSELQIRVHVIPMVDDLVDGRFTLSVRDVTVSDLLRREPNQLDLEAIQHCVTDRRVLVTGGAGSIGSELCRQLWELQPESLTVFDQSEYGVFCLEREFYGQYGPQPNLRFVVGDVLDAQALDRVFSEQRPQVVYHAAAYKHVPLMEENPQAAIVNNVFGTRAVADAADRWGAERFVQISTDKAVRPSSVMGATKLVAERYVQALSQTSDTSFMIVRFGNVLNSMGSVVPTFRRQIEAGGPITVTDPEMKRFFMTIPEAVQLVIQAGAIGPSGHVMILDMGEPVRIVDLARDLILLSGLRYPDDIDIVFSGVRPGEKLEEELFYPQESGARPIHDKIFCSAAPTGLSAMGVLSDLSMLEEACGRSAAAARSALTEVVEKHADRTWLKTPARRAA
ncbi:MAG: polysaccharide biosynthesis protein [Planctomyces sp.]|nr:polysaccharide biosynthesis protein [Planctomyces sp.]